jgi:hypothetical protein
LGACRGGEQVVHLDASDGYIAPFTSEVQAKVRFAACVANVDKLGTEKVVPETSGLLDYPRKEEWAVQ